MVFFSTQKQNFLDAVVIPKDDVLLVVSSINNNVRESDHIPGGLLYNINGVTLLLLHYFQAKQLQLL